MKPPPLVGQVDTAKYQLSWTVPPVDTQHPAATFYHWQVILGDTTPHQALSAALPSSGVTWGYANTVAYGYPARLFDTVKVARPLIDGLRNPTVAHDTRLLELVPFQLTSFDAAAQAAITGAANASG